MANIAHPTHQYNHATTLNLYTYIHILNFITRIPLHEHMRMYPKLLSNYTTKYITQLPGHIRNEYGVKRILIK